MPHSPPAHLAAVMRADSARVKGLGRYAVLRTLDTGARRAMIHLGGRGEDIIEVEFGGDYAAAPIPQEFRPNAPHHDCQPFDWLCSSDTCHPRLDLPAACASVTGFSFFTATRCFLRRRRN